MFYALPNDNEGGFGFGFNSTILVNQYLEYGIELGYDSHSFLFDKVTFVTGQAKIKGFFTKNKWSPYYAVSVGYGIGANSNTFQISNNSGGLTFNPILGISRITNNSKIGINLFIGYKQQEANLFVFDFFNDTISEVNSKFKRFQIGVGVSF